MFVKIILPFIIFAAVCIAFATVFVILRIKKGACPLALIFKTLASLTFTFGGLYAISLKEFLSTANALILVGFILALVGDIFIDLKQISEKPIYLHAGIGFFTLSFMSFGAAVILLCMNLEKFGFLVGGSCLIALIIMVINLLIEKPFKIDYGKYRVAVSIFAFFEAFVAVLSLGICLFLNGFAVFAVGAVLLLASDMVLCHYLFKESSRKNLLVSINHVLYYLGELLIMSYLFFQLI